MSLVWDRGPFEGGSLLVMLALADWANDEGECWPSVPTIGQKARMSDRSIRYILKQLEADGWLKKDMQRGRTHSNTYSLNLQKLHALPSPKKVQKVQVKKDKPKPAICDIKPASDCIKPAIAIAAKPLEPSREPLEENTSRKGAGVDRNSEGLGAKEYIGGLLAFRQHDLDVKKLPAEQGEAAAAKFMFENGWAFEQVKDCYTFLKKQKWRATPVNLITVKQSIADWIKGNLKAEGNGHARSHDDSGESTNLKRHRENYVRFGQPGAHPPVIPDSDGIPGSVPVRPPDRR